jgi:hypothetical protein
MVPPTDAVYPSTEFKDRKGGLVVFGVLTLLIGGLCALMSLGMVALVFHPSTMANGAPPPNPQAMALAVVEFVALAAILIWLGIGSMLARRWARALLLILSWSWLLVGLIALGVMAFTFPRVMEAAGSAAPAGQPALPASAQSVIVAVTMIMMSVIYVILPVVWVLFYKSKNVKETCEALDPVERWTDRCPLPVIAVSLWLGLCAPMMLVAALAYKGVVPFFGMFLVGPLGSALYVGIGLLWGYSAWALYKLDRRGWWIIFVSMALFGVSACLTYSRHDVSELYTLMGFPEAQIAQIEKFGMFKGQAMAWMTLAGVVPFLGYLFYVRKFFPPRVG